ncbi:probable ascorbate-specific transmembrane electron transporter 2 [Oryza brachyantha]|uniref:probable ascorbate-specific transmembrane electron transporter 2 n=1 Tax=Oryza brachyantha TaxID=4533 RepID=UPI0003EAB47F|nr:probable ascorbate-specific transmembrane electron transporter 2 [Oryza brachyantha]
MATELGVKAAPFTYVAHALAVVAAVMVLVWCISFRGGLAFEADNKNLIFNVHPVLMLIGYIILGSEAIMIYKIFPKLNHDTTKLIHLILHAIAIVLGAVGIYCAFKFHNESGIANLYSLHSWLGIGTISLYGIQWIFGFAAFFFPGAAPHVRRGALPWHVLFGLLVYVLTLATAELGLLEKLTFLQSSGLDKYGAEAFLVNFTGLVVVLFGAAVVVAAVAPVHVEEEPEGYAPIPVN